MIYNSKLRFFLFPMLEHQTVRGLSLIISNVKNNYFNLYNLYSCIVLYCIVLYCIVLYCFVLFCVPL